MYSEEDARAELAPHAAALVEIVVGAWGCYLAEGRPRANRTTRANIVNDYMHELVPVHLPEAQVAVSGRKDKPFYALGDVCIRFKNLRGGRASNIVTKVQSAVAEQLVLPLPEPVAAPEQLVIVGLEAPAPAHPPYISIGPELDTTEAEVDGVLAVMWSGNSLLWAIDLRDLADEFGATKLAPVTPIAPAAPAAPLPAIVAKAAPAAREGNDATNLPTVAVQSEPVEVVGDNTTALSESS